MKLNYMLFNTIPAFGHNTSNKCIMDTEQRFISSKRYLYPDASYWRFSLSTV